MKVKYSIYFKILAKKPLLLIRIIENYIRIFVFRQRRLRKVEIGITFECMAHCEKCSSALMRDNKIEKLSFEELRKIAKEVLSLGAIQINFTGGEPLMEENLEKIISFFKPYKTVITINTNGFLLTRERIKLLKTAGVDIFKISIDNPDEEEHDRSRGLKGCYKKAVEAINFITREKGIFAHMSVILTPHLLKEGKIFRLVDLAKRKKITLGITMPAPVGRWLGKEFSFSEDDFREIRDVFKSNFVVSDMDAGYRGEFCPAGKEEIYITCYGDVIPCPLVQISFGNVREESLRNIWQRIYQHPFFNLNVGFCRASRDRNIRGFIEKNFKGRLPVYYKNCTI